MLQAALSNQRSCRLPGALAVAAAWTLCVCLSGGASLAQDDADRATARALAAEGFQALQREDYATAEDRFRRADALVHAPTLVIDRGRALLGMKRYVEAQEQFELVLREGVPDDAPPSWQNALREARSLLEKVKPKVAWLTISVANAPNAEIRVDGQPIPGAALGIPRATNPGTRTVEVSAEGYRPRRLRVELREGAKEALEVTLDSLPRSQRATTGTTDQPPAVDRGEQWQRPLTYAAFGVGGAGLFVGSVTGILALRKHSDLAEVCPGSECPPSQQSAIDAYHRLSWVSGVGFTVGLAGAATGVVLWLKQRDRTGTEPTAAPRLRLDLTPGAAVVRGTF